MKIKMKIKLIIVISVVLLAGLALGGYLALIYVPDWYEPAHVTASSQQQIRDDFTALTSTFNNGMQHPKPFTLTITDKDINRFIAGMGFIDPRLKDAIPTSVENPAVQLDDDYLKVGAIVEQDGKKAFASFWLRVTPLHDWLIIEDLKARIGLYPVPLKIIREKMEKLSGKLAKYSPEIQQILDKGQCPNRFRYPHGSYDFRITHLRANKGMLYVSIEPITRVKDKNSNSLLVP